LARIFHIEVQNVISMHSSQCACNKIKGQNFLIMIAILKFMAQHGH
jgi:hypothetical protein